MILLIQWTKYPPSPEQHACLKNQGFEKLYEHSTAKMMTSPPPKKNPTNSRMGLVKKGLVVVETILLAFSAADILPV